MQWNDIFRQYGSAYASSRKGMLKIVRAFKKHGVKTVLDLGCGAGKHLLYLAEQGFDPCGIDISREAIKTARSLFKEKKVYADLRVGDIFKKLPFKCNSFDAVISIRVLHHAKIKDIRKAISEIERILRPGGLVYITVWKRIKKESRLKYKIIAPRTHIPLEGQEKGVVHYLFNKKLLLKEFRHFKNLYIWVEHGPKKWECYYCLLGYEPVGL